MKIPKNINIRNLTDSQRAILERYADTTNEKTATGLIGQLISEFDRLNSKYIEIRFENETLHNELQSLNAVVGYFETGKKYEIQALESLAEHIKKFKNR